MSDPTIINPVRFSDCESDYERYEFAQYIVNTPADERPEVTAEDAEEALEWAESQL